MFAAEPLLAVLLASLCDSSSMITLLSAADGMVGKKRTLNFGDEHDGSITSSCTTACCRTNRGFALPTVALPVDYHKNETNNATKQRSHLISRELCKLFMV